MDSPKFASAILLVTTLVEPIVREITCKVANCNWHQFLISNVHLVNAVCRGGMHQTGSPDGYSVFLCPVSGLMPDMANRISGCRYSVIKKAGYLAKYSI